MVIILGNCLSEKNGRMLVIDQSAQQILVKARVFETCRNIIFDNPLSIRIVPYRNRRKNG